MKAALDYHSFSKGDGSALPAVPGMGGGFYDVFSAGLCYDDRDAYRDPWSGGMASISLEGSTRFLGSAADYLLVALDGRLYVSLFHRQVLAGRILAQACFGEAPFFALPSFGGMSLGRGYPAGRFSGDYGLFGQLEFRSTIFEILGAVLFLDAGQVCDAPTDLRLDGFHLSFGPGVRFNFYDNFILAFDLGFRDDGSCEFAFNFSPAF
jgi:outer membrane protein assembly factor BamA